MLVTKMAKTVAHIVVINTFRLQHPLPTLVDSLRIERIACIDRSSYLRTDRVIRICSSLIKDRTDRILNMYFTDRVEPPPIFL